MELHAVTQPISGALLEGRVARIERADGLNEEANVAREIEGLFAQIFVKELRRGLGEGFFGQGAGSDTFDAWLDEHLGDSLARDGVLDLAGRIRANLESKRERKEGATEPQDNAPLKAKEAEA